MLINSYKDIIDEQQQDDAVGALRALYNVLDIISSLKLDNKYDWTMPSGYDGYGEDQQTNFLKNLFELLFDTENTKFSSVDFDTINLGDEDEEYAKVSDDIEMLDTEGAVLVYDVDGIFKDKINNCSSYEEFVTRYGAMIDGIQEWLDSNFAYEEMNIEVRGNNYISNSFIKGKSSSVIVADYDNQKCYIIVPEVFPYDVISYGSFDKIISVIGEWRYK